MAAAFGASIVRAPTLVHGEASEVTHDGAGLLAGMPPAFMAARYHSLAVDPATLPPELRVTAMSEVDRVIMGIRHVSLPLEGVQFHPESVLTPQGPHLLANFLRQAGEGEASRLDDVVGLVRDVRDAAGADERSGPGGARHDRRRRHAVDGRGARRDGRGDGRRGDAGPAGGPADGPADARRDGRRAGRLRVRDARTGRPGRGARGRHRRRRDRRRRQRDVQHLDDRRARRGRGRRAGRQARQPRDDVALRVGRRARCARRPDRPRRRVGRSRPARPRLRLPVRRELPPGDAPRRPDPARDRGPDRVQPARPADQPGRHAAAAARCRRRGRRGPDGRGRPAARHRPDVRHPRRRRRRAAARRQRRALRHRRRRHRTPRHRRDGARLQAGIDGEAGRRDARGERAPDRGRPARRARHPARRRPAQRRCRAAGRGRRRAAGGGDRAGGADHRRRARERAPRGAAGRATSGGGGGGRPA